MMSASASDFSRKGPAAVPKPARCAHLSTDLRGYPIIATVAREADRAHFGSLSEQRKLALATFDLCAVCGYPLGNELRWQVSFAEDTLSTKRQIFNEAPVHEICGLYAAQVCPFVSSPYARLGDEWRKGTRRPNTVVLAGYDVTRRVFGHRSGVQRAEYVLHFEMERLVASHTLPSAADAAEAYRQALEAEPPIRIDIEEQELVDRVCSLTAEDDGAHRNSPGMLIEIPHLGTGLRLVP